jgi:hypothetical protein
MNKVFREYKCINQIEETNNMKYVKYCKVAREVVGGPRGPIVIIVEVIQCKVD